MDTPFIKHISEHYIKPKYLVEESKKPYYLSTHWDLILLSVHYNQKGLLFSKQVPNFSIDNLLDSLKDSLSLTLVHFYPLAGQLVTSTNHEQYRTSVYVDCNKGPGARFIHASIQATVDDIFPSNGYVPPVVNSFFDHNNVELNYDGHFMPLLSIQVTELIDGIFIGCSMNHVIVDGSSFWHFWNVWSQIQREKGDDLVVAKPIHKRWIIDEYKLDELFLPYTHPEEFLNRFKPADNLVERYFHISYDNISRLKFQANRLRLLNSELEKDENKVIGTITSFQAIIAVLWKAIVKTMGLPRNQVTLCKFSVNDRTRVDPPLPPEYFGNSLNLLQATTTIGELLDNNIGWVASLLNQAIKKHTEKFVYEFCHNWIKSPIIYRLGTEFEPGTVKVGSSPRFNVYGNEFNGMGKPLAVRSGKANKYGGKVTIFPGPSQDGSMDVELCLPSDTMHALEDDKEFMNNVVSF